MFSTILLIGAVVTGFVAAITLGSQAYFLGEMTKPIHQRNWNSSSFDTFAETLTGEKIDVANRVPGFDANDTYVNTMIAQQ